MQYLNGLELTSTSVPKYPRSISPLSGSDSGSNPSIQFSDFFDTPSDPVYNPELPVYSEPVYQPVTSIDTAPVYQPDTGPSSAAYNPADGGEVSGVQADSDYSGNPTSAAPDANRVAAREKTASPAKDGSAAGSRSDNRKQDAASVHERIDNKSREKQATVHSGREQSESAGASLAVTPGHGSETMHGDRASSVAGNQHAGAAKVGHKPTGMADHTRSDIHQKLQDRKTALNNDVKSAGSTGTEHNTGTEKSKTLDEKGSGRSRDEKVAARGVTTDRQAAAAGARQTAAANAADRSEEKSSDSAKFKNESNVKSTSMRDGKIKSRGVHGGGNASASTSTGQPASAQAGAVAARNANSSVHTVSGNSADSSSDGDSQVLASLRAIRNGGAGDASGSATSDGSSGQHSSGGDKSGTFSNIMFQSNSASAAPVQSGELQVVFTPDAMANQVQNASAGDGSTASARTMSASDLAAQFRQQFRGQLGSDIVRQARYVLRGQNSGEISLVLKPEKLGRVRIHMNLEDKSIAGKIFVENKTVQEAFSQVIDDLKQAFLQQGFDNLSLDVALDDDNAGNDSQTVAAVDGGRKHRPQGVEQMENSMSAAQAYVKEFAKVNILA